MAENTTEKYENMLVLEYSLNKEMLILGFLSCIQTNYIIIIYYDEKNSCQFDLKTNVSFKLQSSFCKALEVSLLSLSLEI